MSNSELISRIASALIKAELHERVSSCTGFGLSEKVNINSEEM